MEDLQRTLALQNVVVDSGGIDLPTERLRIEQSGAFSTPEDIADLVIRGKSVSNLAVSDELIRLRDIATIRRGYVEPPIWQMRYNGQPAIGMALSNVPGANVVDLGQNVEARMDELMEVLPVGVELHKIAWQSDLVSESIVDFMVSLIQAVAIVLVVLWLAMGFRVAAIVGMCGLVFTILVSFMVMDIWGIDLQRMSLGALIIAMGMMVDNAIVVVDGMLVRLQQGMNRVKAAAEAATLPSIPLLGATIIAVMAFYPIYASEESAGEYCATLFQVVAVSLMLSWVLSITITPLVCIWALPDPTGSSDADPYAGRLYRMFASVLAAAMRFRIAMMGLLIACLFGALFAFGWIDRTFFPNSARLQLMVDYWAPQGTRIQTVSGDLARIEEELLGDERVDSVSAFIGQGPPRFYLPVEPEMPYSSYAQLIVNLKSLDGLNDLIPDLDSWLHDNVPQALTTVRRYGLGPSETWTVEARISGPAIADGAKLRELANQAQEIMRRSEHAKVVRTNWRQQVKKVKAYFAQERARWSSVSRSDIGRATRGAFDGYPVGQYRERDKLYPIILRQTEDEREMAAAKLPVLQVLPTLSTEAVPLMQVADPIAIEWEDAIIWRFDRRRTITVQAIAPDGTPASNLLSDVRADLESMELPPGYQLEWGGEYESSRDAQESLIPGIVPAMGIMALIIVGLFNAFRPPLIIVCVIPFAMIGVSIGLLSTGQPFGFLALLGAMSLAGMMVKNAIVLLDQINIEKAEGKSDYDAVMMAALSRLRPVVLAAATTVLGVIPLLGDVFWVAMAVTIMFGLAFGTVLTMMVIPMLYGIFYRIPVPGKS
jgi:multidrug efflux pump subunit AcrB